MGEKTHQGCKKAPNLTVPVPIYPPSKTIHYSRALWSIKGVKASGAGKEWEPKDIKKPICLRKAAILPFTALHGWERKCPRHHLCDLRDCFWEVKSSMKNLRWRQESKFLVSRFQQNVDIFKLSKRTVFRKGKTRTQKTLGITTTPKCFRLQEITIHVFAGGHTIFPYYLVQNDSSLPKSFFSNHDFPFILVQCSPILYGL